MTNAELVNRPLRVKLGGGKTALCRSLAIQGDVVFVTTEAEYQKAHRLGENAKELFGIMKGDILEVYHG
jgi:hypothetical protein